jgi:hypothetical protein
MRQNYCIKSLLVLTVLILGTLGAGTFGQEASPSYTVGGRDRINAFNGAAQNVAAPQAISQGATSDAGAAQKQDAVEQLSSTRSGQPQIAAKPESEPRTLGWKPTFHMGNPTPARSEQAKPASTRAVSESARPYATAQPPGGKEKSESKKSSVSAQSSSKSVSEGKSKAATSTEKKEAPQTGPSPRPRSSDSPR